MREPGWPSVIPVVDRENVVPTRDDLVRGIGRIGAAVASTPGG